MSFINDLATLVNTAKESPFPQSPTTLMESILHLAHKHNISTMQLILKVNEIEKKELKDEALKNWHGVDSACNALVTMIEKSTEKSQAGKFANEVLFNPENIAFTIQHLKAWIPNPEKGGFSSSTRDLLNKVLDTFDLDQYMECGPSHDWAKMFNHYEYIQRLKILQDARKESLASNPTE